MMSTQDVKKVVKILNRIGPNPKDVVQITEVVVGFLWAFGEDSLLPLRHLDIGISRSELLPHSCPVDLEVSVAIELKIVTVETEL